MSADQSDKPARVMKFQSIMGAINSFRNVPV